MHIDDPLGRGPLMGRFCPTGSLTMARTVASPCLMHRSFMSWVSPCWNWGCGLETTFRACYHCLGYRGTRPPCPYYVASYCAASSTIVPIRGYRGWHHSSTCTLLVRNQSTPEAGQHPKPVNARGRVGTGMLLGPFCESLLRFYPKTFCEIRRRALAHSAADDRVTKERCFVGPVLP